MDITRTTVPGVGIVHHFVTRGGHAFGVLADQSDHRKLLIYGPMAGTAVVVDEPLVTIVLESDEADRVADLLHSSPIPDRVAELERRFMKLAETV